MSICLCCEESNDPDVACDVVGEEPWRADIHQLSSKDEGLCFYGHLGVPVDGFVPSLEVPDITDGTLGSLSRGKQPARSTDDLQPNHTMVI